MHSQQLNVTVRKGAICKRADRVSETGNTRQLRVAETEPFTARAVSIGTVSNLIYGLPARREGTRDRIDRLLFLLFFFLSTVKLYYNR
ncbi:hypothetical protein [Mesorhizobium qingshengii]|uniref:hypothetical protein n=1 Tax=Mesorhizobium qingshengii TaxID=1165689 RepID=UPI000B896351|nr:hypothetical protein [Mesorhizobium qingshengii]